MSEYTEQAEAFLKSNGIKFTARFITYGFHWPEDKERRNIWRLTLKRRTGLGVGLWIDRHLSARFGQSICGTRDKETPTAYDLLACLTKSDPGSFENFCSDYGCNTDSRQAERTYKAVIKEWKRAKAFFTKNELAQLQEIN